MKVSVIGLGHVGLVTAGALARWGHEVIGYDVDTSKMEKLLGGEVPFYEPGLGELVSEGHDAGRLRYTVDLPEALTGAQVVCLRGEARKIRTPGGHAIKQIGR